MDNLIKVLVSKESNRAVLAKVIIENVPESQREAWLYNLLCDVSSGKRTVKSAVDMLREGDDPYEENFLAERAHLENEVKLVTQGVDVEEGVFTCGKCGSRRIHVVSKQTRSADESATVKAKCTQCGCKWTASQK